MVQESEQMKKKFKKIKSGIVFILIGLLINSWIFVSPVAAANLPENRKIQKNYNEQSELYTIWLRLVEHQKYDQAVLALHDKYKLSDMNSIAMITKLDQKETALILLKKYTVNYRPQVRETASLYQYAIELARRNNLQEALTLLGWLYANNRQNRSILEDYIVVAGWAGHNRQAIRLFETSTLPSAEDLPVYVLNGIGGSYYNLQNFAKAEYYFAEAAAHEDHFARIWQAQSYFRMGQRQKANQLYEGLLKANPQDIEVLRSQISMNLWAGNNEEALEKLQQIKKLSIRDPEVLKAVDDDMAIAYIRLSENGKAILLLKPYVDNGQANVFMQADYILALKGYEDYGNAISEGQKLWKDWSNVPIYGLQACADSYVRLGEIKKALPIYRYITQRDPKYKGITLTLGFSNLMEGHIAEGLKQYDRMIKGDRQAADIALFDAYYFFTLGKYEAGKSLYALVLHRYPDIGLYRREYADTLQDNNMEREAFQQYHSLTQVTASMPQGLQGVVSMAVNRGDYHAAHQALTKLQTAYANSKESYYAAKRYAERIRGQLDADFSTNSDYQGYTTSSWQIKTGQNLLPDSNYSILTQRNRTKIISSDSGLKTTLDSEGVGVGFKDIACDYQLWYDHYHNNGTFNGYSFHSDYYPNDHLAFGFAVSQAPLAYSPESLNPQSAGDEDSRIMTNNYTFRTHIKQGKREDYDISYTHSRYSDNNTVNSCAFDWTKTLLYNDGHESYRTLYWGQDRWKLQRPELYDSPAQRNTYGISREEIWKYHKKFSWDLTYALEFGKDSSEATELQPHVGLSYVYQFTPTKKLTLSAEYGLRTDRTNGRDALSHFSYRQYGIDYTMNW
jgi:predicted Zn-dependent protease